MKKLLVVLSVLVFSVFLVTGCGNGGDNGADATDPNGDDAPASTYNDGTYTAVSANANERGYVEVTLSIADDEITDVSMDEYDAFGNIKDYETYGVEDVWDGSDLLAAHEALAEAMVENNTYDVDIVSGATGTSEKAVVAAERALEAAKR